MGVLIHDAVVTTPTIPWTPLEPGQLKAMQINAAFTALFVLIFAGGVDLSLFLDGKTPLGVIAVPAALLSLYYVFVAMRRRFRRWGYSRTQDELHVAHGVVVHTETSVAFHRVQHIDIEQGPIERYCGVWQLVLNTAGTHNSKIRLPGLSRATAESLRDEIRLHVRADRE